MKDIRNITNREEIVERLAGLLMQFDKDLNGYQTDVYMYIDEETGAASLKTFPNVGGSSWLNDNHTTIYTDREHFDSMYEYFVSVYDIAEFLGMAEYDQLKGEVVQNLVDIGAIDEAEAEAYEPCWNETIEYIKTVDDYVEILNDSYHDMIESDRCYYISSAEKIIKGAEQSAADAEEIRNIAQTQEITYAESEDYEPIWSGTRDIIEGAEQSAADAKVIFKFSGSYIKWEYII